MTDKEKDIPKHWKIKKLEELLPYVIGGDWGKDEFFSDPDFSFAYCIRSSEIKNWKEEKGKTASLRKVKIQSIEKRELRQGDIIIEISGGGPEQPVGRTLLIDNQVLAYKPNIPKICTNFFRLIRPSDDINSSFLDLYLKFFYTSGEVVKFQAGSNNLRNLKFSDYIKIPIPIPPISEQKAIVEKIEEYFTELDKGIEELRTAQDQLKVYRQSLLKWAFEGKLTNDNVEEGKLPKGWKFSSLENFIEKPKYGTSKKCEYVGQIGVLRIPNIVKGSIDVSDLKRADFTEEEKETYSLQQGDILVIRSNGSVDIVGKSAIVKEKEENYLYAGYLIRLRCKSDILSPHYLLHILSSSSLRIQIETKAKSTSGVNNINSEELKSLVITVPPTIKEQQKIVEILEEKLSVCDQMEQTIVQSLKQAESLRQSILKQAFEGKLVAVQEEVPAYVPNRIPFYQAQLFGYMIATSANNNIDHGEMTLAKNAYLLDKIYDVPTFFNYQRWHLGPYPPEMKGVLNGGSLKQFFNRVDYHIELQNSDKLFKYTNPYEARTRMAMEELSAIFSLYDDKERSYQTELLATVCKVIEDIQATDLKAVRTSMKEWKIDLKTTKFKNKAEKFSESDTASCLNFIITRGWDKKLMN